jgi:hypothetical protein
MPTTIAMQDFLSLIGTTGVTAAIIQPSPFWVDGQQAKEAVFDVQILQGHTGLTLMLETAVAGQGPWREIESYDTNTITQTALYATSREGGGTQFERFLRWKLDRRNATPSPWTTCFKICVTLR